MVQRKVELVTDETYHVFSRSIARYTIFNNEPEYCRMKESLRFYRVKKPSVKFDRYLTKEHLDRIQLLEDCEQLVNVIAYCQMPTHIHLVVKQLMDDGIATYMGNLLNGYARYFNTKHGRKGPLWESRFKNVRVENDEQLLHLTRYLHLNPSTSYLVSKPEEWPYSSYSEYVLDMEAHERLCDVNGILDIDRREYRKFVEDNIDYQRSLASIKSLIIE